MKQLRLFLLLLVASFAVSACQSEDESALKALTETGYSDQSEVSNLSSGGKAQYIKMELAIHQRYVRSLDSLINTSFERQLERFEDEELGVLSGYGHMFSWLFSSEASWEDEMKLLSNKYFNSLDTQTEQHALYLDYSKKISALRQQFVASEALPSYTPIDVPEENITLSAFATIRGTTLLLS